MLRCLNSLCFLELCWCTAFGVLCTYIRIHIHLLKGILSLVVEAVQPVPPAQAVVVIKCDFTQFILSSFACGFYLVENFLPEMVLKPMKHSSSLCRIKDSA